MPIFKCALKVLVSHKVYILVYTVWLAFMGVFMGLGAGTPAADPGAWEGEPLSVGFVDRDGGAVAEGLRTLLASRDAVADVPDETLAMQDAIAKGEVDVLVIVPEGFGEEYVAAVRAGGELPEVQIAQSYYGIASIDLEAVIDSYLSCLGVRASFDDTASLATLAESALEDCEAQSEASYVVPEGVSAPLPQSFTIYALFTSYPIMCSLVVLISVTLREFAVGAVRERTAASPQRSLALSLSVAGASLVCALAVWGIMCGVGFCAFGWSIEGVAAWRINLVCVAMLCYAIFSLSVGFLLGQLGVGDAVSNAVGNILALVLSFIGGSWVSIDLLGPELQMLAHFTPNYWEACAIELAAGSTGTAGQIWAQALPDLGIVLLFAAAIGVVGLVVGRARLATAPRARAVTPFGDR